MDAWSRKQYAAAETKLHEAASILEEIYREENKACANRPMGWQLSQAGEAQQDQLYRLQTLLNDLYDACEEIADALTAEPEQGFGPSRS